MMIIGGARSGVWISDYCCKTEVRNSCVPQCIDHDIRLKISQWVGGSRVSDNTYPFEISMDHVARVKILKTFGDAQQLRVRRGLGRCPAGVSRNGPTRLTRSTG